MTCFLDTNVVVYAFTDSPKREAALRLIGAGGVISVQVLNEFANVSRKKLGRNWDEIERATTLLQQQFSVQPLLASTHSRALALMRNSLLAFYDALIVSAAMEAGCGVLFSEDLQNGQRFDGLEVRNPFIDNTSS